MGLLRAILRILNWFVERIGGVLGALVLAGSLTLLLFDAWWLIDFPGWILGITIPFVLLLCGFAALVRPAYMSLFFLPTLFMFLLNEDGPLFDLEETPVFVASLVYLAGLAALIIGSAMQHPIWLFVSVGCLAFYAWLAPGAWEINQKKQVRPRR